ncbi:MAG: hypothetical protein RL208_106 [Pseudomonadota bacterium]|jgi:starvation-inducible DNA-binding protein
MKNQSMFTLLSSYYGYYLKAQAYHWNVVGSKFFSIHKFFEIQYERFAADIDEIAEMIRILGESVDASFESFAKHSIVSKPNIKLSGKDMILDVYGDNQKLCAFIKEMISEYEDKNEPVVVDMLTQKLSVLMKDAWMIKADLE